MSTCATCWHWSPDRHGAGECTEYILRRQLAFARADDTVAFHAAWPHLPERNTAAASPLTPAQIAAIKALARAFVARELRDRETHREAAGRSQHPQGHEG